MIRSIIAILFISIVLVYCEQQTNRVCSPSPGVSIRSDPRTCRCYYKCSQAFFLAHLCCENGQLFNPDTEGCDEPHKVNCTITEVDRSVTEATSSKPPSRPDPEICFEGIGHYTDPQSENCYYQCDARNYAHHRCCAPGLIFNQEIRSCDW